MSADPERRENAGAMLSSARQGERRGRTWEAGAAQYSSCKTASRRVTGPGGSE